MSPRVLVYGWYNQGNLGDDLFADAFRGLFPTFQFTFTDHIKAEQLKGIDAVFLGGGSFLGESLKIDPSALTILKTLKVFYIGVGSETSIHPSHQDVMAGAKLIAPRNATNLSNLQKINPNCLVIPDLVYSLSKTVSATKQSKSVLVFPNISVVPRWDDPHWKHAAWDYFKNEFAQFLDVLYEDGYKVKFLPMCVNEELNDCFAAAEIINKLKYRSTKSLLPKPVSMTEALDLMSRAEVIVTQRFHGAILAELAGTTSLTIHHHDKLKGVAGPTLSYYGITKAALLSGVNQALQTKVSPLLPIYSNIFEKLVQAVITAMT